MNRQANHTGGRWVNRWSAAIVLGKLLMAVVLAVAATVVIGMMFGIPRDAESLERKLQAFEQASYRDGRAVSDEVRNKTLTEEGYTFHAPPGGSASSVGQYKVMKLFEGAIRWYPGVFGIAFLLSLSVIRPGMYAGIFVTVVIAPLALILGQKVAIFVALVGLIYFALEKVRTRGRAALGAGA